MTDQQLYLSSGLPSVLVLAGILVNVGYFVAISGRIQALETRLDGRINSLVTKFDLLIGKVFELDNRLTRIEVKLSH
jgi:hypothetical protein